MSDTADRPPYPSRLPSGEWRCIRDHRTEPCGDCVGCHEVQDENRSRAEKIEAHVTDDIEEYL